MRGLRVAIASVRSEPNAGSPTLVFRALVEEPSGAFIQAALLRCQVFIDIHHRTYSGVEGERMKELFGGPARWVHMRPLLWTTVPVVLSRCEGTVNLDVSISCSFDFEVSSGKYFRALEEGEVPLLFIFSGTIFAAESSARRVAQMSWDTDTRFSLPVRTWCEAMEQHFGDDTWVRLSRHGFDTLDDVRRRRGFTTWDEVVEELCAANVEPAPAKGTATAVQRRRG